MSGYSIGLFVHVTAALALFMGIGVSRLAFGEIRRARTVARLRLWLGVARRTRVVFPASLVTLLGSGLFLTAQSWSFSTPWVATSLAGLVVLGAVGARINGGHARGIAQALGDAPDCPVPPAVVERQRRNGPFVVGYALNGMALGIVFLMTTKPGWTGSVIGLIVGLAAGALLSALVVRSSGGKPSPARSAPARAADG